MSRSDSQAWRDLCNKIEALMDAHHIDEAEQAGFWKE